jgi:hypothetical protein
VFLVSCFLFLFTLVYELEVEACRIFPVTIVLVTLLPIQCYIFHYRCFGLPEGGYIVYSAIDAFRGTRHAAFVEHWSSEKKMEENNVDRVNNQLSQH